MASTMRVVLLGKTGSGKSSLANTIFGDDHVFTVNHSPNSQTSVCESVTRKVHGRDLTLIDTPGFFYINPNNSAFRSEIMHFLEKCGLGPHAFLLVLKWGKLTLQEWDGILRHFSPVAFRYTTVVFTHGQNLPPGERIADWARENDALRALLQKCGNRCHVVDNRYWRNQEEIYRNNQNQVQDLLNTIDLASKGTMRVVLLGKTGSGKSTLANTIFGVDDVFAVSDSPNSQTSVCKSETRKVHGRNLTLIDTPGLFETDPNSSAFSSEIMHLLEECAPGPHAFLLVLKVEKYTAQEQAVVDLILQYFSPQALKYTTVVFTHGNNLPRGVRISDWAQRNPALTDLLQKCGNRCHVVDSRHWRKQGVIFRNNQNQVLDLLNTIDLANGGSCFTNDLLQNISLWKRFKEAPIGYKIAAFLGVAAVGCLLYACVPWAEVCEWVNLGVKNGAGWIWQNLPTTNEIKKAVVYLTQLTALFQGVTTLSGAVRESSGGSCTIM